MTGFLRRGLQRITRLQYEMPGAAAFIQWENVASPSPYFQQRPLTFNSRQERLHLVTPGSRLWLVSRCPHDQRYYFAGVLTIRSLRINPPGSELAEKHGSFSLEADPDQSHNLGKRFPAEEILRDLQFEPNKPIKDGGSIGQSLQAIRLLAESDEQLLDSALGKTLAETS